MAGNPNAGDRSATVQQALSVVDLGRQATKAYARPDLSARLAATHRRLSDPAFHVFVIGEFKQGKSSLVNALLNALVEFGPDLWKATTDTFLMVGVTMLAAVLLGTPLGVLLFVTGAGGLYPRPLLNRVASPQLWILMGKHHRPFRQVGLNPFPQVAHNDDDAIGIDLFRRVQHMVNQRNVA